MNSHKNLAYVNVQTNCNLSSSLITIEELINYAVINKISSLALCEYNPYEFLKFYYLCRNANIKPVWGFKKVVNYNGHQLICNFFPRKYSEYKQLNKFFYSQNENEVISWSLLEWIVPKCLFVLEIHDHEEIISATKFKSEISQYFGEKYLQNIYFGLNFFPSSIEFITRTNLQTSLLPFFSVRSFNWDDHELLVQLEKTNLISGIINVSYSKSIPYLSGTDLLSYFKSHLGKSFAIESIAKFFNYLFSNLETFLSKINLFIRRSTFTEKEEKFKLLKQQCEEKLNLLINDYKRTSYLEVLEKELVIIKEKGYANYFLELAKIVKIFLQNNIEIGPGRGSATSSLVGYLLGLTLIDPFQNKLFFWRFLNEKRTDFPDIDIDVENQEAALDLIVRQYGRQSVAKLLVKKRIGWHAAVIASLKVFNVEGKDAIFIGENVVRFLHKENAVFSLKISYFLEKYNNLFTFARRIYLLYNGIAPHPSGVIISEGKLSEKLPVKDRGGIPLCLYQQKYIANLGFKKFDFLSLTESLSFIRYIKEKNQSMVPTYMNLDMDNSKTWNLLKESLLMGIFQINTKLFREIITIFQPTSFTELLLMISLNRPGASISLKEFSQVRFFNQIGGEHKKFVSESLTEILSPTYGKIIFEEQVSQILAYCFSISFAEAELIRRSLKTIVSNNDDRRKLKLEFISKTTGKLKLFEKDILWEKIIKSIPYLFNKAHATSYAYLTYYTAYLKANFFADALTFFLQRNTTGDYKLIALLSEEAVLMGYRLEVPDINISFWESRVSDKIAKVLVMGFSQIGKNSYSFFEKVTEERSRNGVFKDWQDLLTRLSWHFNNLETSDLITWIESGLFRSFSGSQQWVVRHLTSFKRYARIVNSLKNFSTKSLPFLLLPEKSSFDHSLLWENKKQWESFYFYPSYLVRWKNSAPQSLRRTREQLSILYDNHKNLENIEMKVHSVLVKIRKGRDCYLLTLLLFNFSFEVSCDFDFYQKNSTLLEIHNEAVFVLKSKKEEFRNSLFIDSMFFLRSS